MWVIIRYRLQASRWPQPGERDGLWYILGEHEGKPVFRMNLRYEA